MTPDAKAQTVKTLARQLGCDLVGITLARPVERADYYRQWLSAGYGGSMSYLRRNVRVRLDPRNLLPGARSIICAAISYRRADGYERDPGPALPMSERAASDLSPTGRVAQYARGEDYHVVLHQLLGALVERLRAELAEPFEARVFVDTGPLFERELAAAAGLGWIGRNTCLLNRDLGSYLLLGEVVTTLALRPDEPLPDGCGQCRRCIDSCPTRALVGPYRLDASRCVSYLTIEQRAPIAPEFHAGIGDWLCGCDRCQQVCPYNARAPLGGQPAIMADRTPARLELAPLLNLRTGDYRRLTRGTALARVRRPMWQRNAAIVLGNRSPLP